MKPVKTKIELKLHVRKIVLSASMILYGNIRILGDVFLERQGLLKLILK